jgi:ABC-type sugar transport system ATPase subunit
LRFSEMRRRALQLVERYRFPVPTLDAKLSDLSGGQQKAVAIGRAVLSEPKILLLDEPTASLGVTEQQLVHQVVTELQRAGVGIIICSHSLAEVRRLADRLIALRSGRLIEDRPLAGCSQEQIALMMSG